MKKGGIARKLLHGINCEVRWGREPSIPAHRLSESYGRARDATKRKVAGAMNPRKSLSMLFVCHCWVYHSAPASASRYQRHSKSGQGGVASQRWTTSVRPLLHDHQRCPNHRPLHLCARDTHWWCRAWRSWRDLVNAMAPTHAASKPRHACSCHVAPKLACRPWSCSCRAPCA